MGSALNGSTYKFKNIEIAYDSLQNAKLYDIAQQVADVMASHGYYPQVVGNKYKFRYRG